MGYLDATMATTTGVAVFALVVYAVATALTGIFPNPIQIAIPVGIGFGTAAMTGTYMGLAAKTEGKEYRIAFASGAFGVTSLGVGLVAFGTDGSIAFALTVGTAAGLLAAVGVFAASR
jgi:hypothetical protein